MTVLEIISFDSCCKTTLAAGIGKKLLSAGRKVGYIKPVHAKDKGHEGDCPDAQFMKAVLEISDDVDVLCPLHINQEDLWKSLSEDAENFTNRIKADCDKAASGKDVLIVESPAGLKGNKVAELAATTLIEKLGGKAVLVTCYDTGYKSQELVQFAKKLGDRLIGVIINRVPETRITAVQKDAAEYLKAENVTLLGVIPEARALMGASIGEIASAIGGELLTFKEKSGDLVENVMLGAMTPDSGKDYFSRMKNKAVLARSEKADMQLAAMDTPMKCLIVAGGKPTTSVMVKADDKKIPIIVVNKDIQDIVSGIEQALAATRFNSPGKLQVISNLMEGRIDFKALNAALGY